MLENVIFKSWAIILALVVYYKTSPLGKKRLYDSSSYKCFEVGGAPTRRRIVSAVRLNLQPKVDSKRRLLNDMYPPHETCFPCKKRLRADSGVVFILFRCCIYPATIRKSVRK